MAKHTGLIGCSMFILSLLFAATEATEYNVGGSFGWNTPPNQTFYSDWASSKTFFVGDSLVFNLTENQNFADVTMADYNSCSTNTDPFAGNGPSRIVFTVDLLHPGPRYFISTVDNHCARGQKFSINVEKPFSFGPSPSATPPSINSALSAFLSTIAVYFFTRI
ncbi:umecyanin-like [Prosopis cineraria]|uniref:umecyanin-like n=1 Tax=Prosopis cineraria TaxID=364024 RepID=UPI00240E9E24|nr:umecyanin-like [Prosopis cineraria]XP_054822400.1 umecyanin-like [Prosopis cineraria]